jgi:mitochondrial import inner membrane translocase subunit TIM17
MSYSAADREPCPWRIVEDAGGAFVFGLVGGIIWHSVGGARNAPRGEVMRQVAYRVKTRVPIVAGSFAVWGVCFSSFDCTFTALRKKEDPWNAILSGAATGA